MSTTVPPQRPEDAPTKVRPREVITPPAETGATPAGAVPHLAEGVELVGRFEGSGFKEPPFIARRADGQMVQMAPLLFALAEEVQRGGSHDAIATRLSHRIERGVTGEMAEMLIEEQLRPLGIVAPRDGGEPELKKVDPLLALKFRTKVVPERVTRALTTVFQPLFFGPVVVAVVAALVALDVWLFGVHGISQSLRHVIYEPALLLMLVAGVVVATAFHEIGHASACRYGGAKPGVMGIGIYIVWPAFYTDITDAYRLDKKGRLRTDLGGMYFNAVFALVVAAAYAATRFEPLLLLIVLQTFAIVQQSLPFLRLDGYYIISDLTGVPDILLRMRSILVSVLPWRESDERVTELKPWVRVVVTAYVCVLVPVIALMFLMMLVNAPRVFATGWDSFWVQWDRVAPAFDAGQTSRGAMSIFQMLVLALPAAGIVYTSTRVGHRFGAAGWRWSAGDPMRRAAMLAGTAAAAAALAFLWWPNGDYRPIQPGERGTIFGAMRTIADIPSGRAALTAQREQQLGGAPTERSLQRHGAAHVRPDSETVSPTPASGRGGGGATRGTQGTTGSVTSGQGSTAPGSGQPATGGSGSAAPPSSQQQGGTATQPQQSPQPGSTTPQGTTTTPQDTTTTPQATTTPSTSGSGTDGTSTSTTTTPTTP